MEPRPEQSTTQNKKLEFWEKYIAASCYMFDFGYILYSFKKQKSEFVEYHNQQAGRLIKFLLLPAALLIFFIGNIFSSQIPHYAGLVLVGLYFITMGIGIRNSIKSVKKKIL